MAHAAPSSVSGVSLLNAKDSAAIDVDLMSSPGFSIDQVAPQTPIGVGEADVSFRDINMLADRWTWITPL